MAHFKFTADRMHIEARSSFIDHQDGPAALTDLFDLLLKEADRSTPDMHLPRLEGLRWRVQEMLNAINERRDEALQKRYKLTRK
jgi:hypothetical protein